MRVRIEPGSSLKGEVRVPGDKSIAHRWLILAATGHGGSRLVGVPPSLDVRSTASCLGVVTVKARPALDVWARKGSPRLEPGGSTWNTGPPGADPPVLEVQGEGRAGLVEPSHDLDCGNSGTSMRLLAGVMAGASFRSVLSGDQSLSGRPMERVAAPLRAMGAAIETTDGHPPITIVGAALHGISYDLPVASASVKGAVLFAAAGASGPTMVRSPAATRDHTERAFAALGAPVRFDEAMVELESGFEHVGFMASVPGDASSAAFLVAAAALTGSPLTITDLGLNPSRLHFLRVMERMGISTEATIEREELGEPVGRLHVAPSDGIRPTRVTQDELPLVIDEVPVLALLAAHAPGDTWFLGAAELRVKESDRLGATAQGIRALGGQAADEGDDLVVAGGGLEGGIADAHGDHRMAMSLAVGALAARAPTEVHDMRAAEVSFPGFVQTLVRLGAAIEVVD